MKKYLFIFCLLSTSCFANDQQPHTCAVVNPNGTIDNIIIANPDAPDNDVSPIVGDDLVVIDGEDYHVGDKIQ